MTGKIYRFVFLVPRIDEAERFYAKLLQNSGKRISPGQHSFEFGDMILTFYSPKLEGREEAIPTSPGSGIVLQVAVQDLQATFDRAKTCECAFLDEKIVTRPWGEQSFRIVDPFGNSLVLVDEATMQQQIRENTSQVDARFRAGMSLYLQAAESGRPKRTPAKVIKVFPDQLWLTLSLAQINQPRFAEGEDVRIQYVKDGKAFLAHTRVAKLSALGHQHLAIAMPSEAQLLRRRSGSRLPCRLPVEVSILQASSRENPAGGTIAGKTHDVSVGGARIDVEQVFQAGEELKVCLKLPSPHEPVTALAKVVWSIPIEESRPSLYATGVQFLEVDLHEQMRLLRFMIELAEGRRRVQEDARTAPESAESGVSNV